MSNKYLLMTEEEFEAALYYQERSFGCSEDSEAQKEFREAESACRAREVPDWATHFVANLEGPLDYGLYSIDNDKEIKK